MTNSKEIPVTSSLEDALAEEAAIRESVCQILAQVAVILRGTEPMDAKWSYRDIPAQVAALKSALNSAKAGQRFAGLILNDIRDYGWAADVEGYDLMLYALESGLAYKKVMTQEDHDNGDECTNCDDECDVCTRFTTEAEHAIDAAIPGKAR